MLAAKSWITPFNLHPLYIYVIAYMIGIWAQVHEHFYIACACIAIGLVLIRIIESSYFFQIAAFSLLFFIGGMYRIKQQIAPYTQLFSQKELTQVQCTGTVCDITTYKHPYFKQRITIETDTLHSRIEPSLAYGLEAYVYLFFPETESFEIGDEITIHNLALRTPQSRDALIKIVKNKVIGLHFQTKKNTSTHQKTLVSSWQHYFFDIKKRVTNSVCAHMDTATQAFYTSLFLGNKVVAPLSMYTTSRFSLWGISHHLARSGLHLIIVIWLWSTCIQRAPVSRSAKHSILILLGLIYYSFSWPTLSFNRACLSFLLYQCCAWIKDSLDPMQAIGWVTLCFLIVSPADLFSLDFQLSFGLTHAIAWFNHTNTKTRIDHNKIIA